MSESVRQPGRIATFYSYKGGTGRSMALANVAWILASQGHKVLAIDWDLEAPGLHRYFQPFLRDPTLVSCEGVMDLVVDFAAAAVSSKGRQSDDAHPWFRRHADVRRYAFSLEWNGFPEDATLDLMPAGRQDAGYAVRVNSFNWQHFYDKLGGGIFLEEMKRQLRSRYDYVLIDSRTGVSDTSGICTVQMPDDLVVCFTLNQQSIEGASSAAISALQQRRRPDGSSGLRVLPVPTRVDLSEKERLDLARNEAQRRFGSFLDDWLDDDQIEEYWGTVEVPYVPFYAFEEVLATFGDKPSNTKSVLAAMQAITGWLTEKRVTQLARQDETRRLLELKRFLREGRPASQTSSSDHLILISYARHDISAELERFVTDLAEEVAVRTGQDRDRVAFMPRNVRSEDMWAEAVSSAAASSRVLLSIVTPAYVSSKTNPEWGYFRQAGKSIVHVPWVPTRIPPYMQDLQFLQLTGYGAKEGVRAMLRLAKYEEEYRAAVMELAKLVADEVWRSTMRLNRPLKVGPPAQFKGARTKPQLRFVVLAERADAIRSVRSNIRPYGLRRQDWRPFWSAQGKTAGEIASEVASQIDVPLKMMALNALDEWIARPEKPPGDELVVLVDPWTVTIPDHRALLQRLTHQSDTRCAVVVCFDADSETQQQLMRLRQGIDFSPAATSSAGAAPFPNPYARQFIAEVPAELTQKLQEAHRYLQPASTTP